MTRSESKSLEKRLEILVGGNDDWVPPFVRECCSVEETTEWRRLFARETATLRALCHQPIVDHVRHPQALAAARAPMLAFEKRMRLKYPHMPETMAEMEAEDIARAENDAEYREREGLNQKGPYD